MSTYLGGLAEEVDGSCVKVWHEYSKYSLELRVSIPIELIDVYREPMPGVTLEYHPKRGISLDWDGPDGWDNSFDISEESECMILMRYAHLLARAKYGDT